MTFCLTKGQLYKTRSPEIAFHQDLGLTDHAVAASRHAVAHNVFTLTSSFKRAYASAYKSADERAANDVADIIVMFITKSA